MAQHQILIVGGGAAGLTVASQLQRARPELQITILEPSVHHDYQPGWTLVAAGVFSLEQTRRDEAGLIPAGVTWIREAAASFDPDAATVHTSAGRRLGYDVLIVATGIRLCWERVRGLRRARLLPKRIASALPMRYVVRIWCLSLLAWVAVRALGLLRLLQRLPRNWALSRWRWSLSHLVLRAYDGSLLQSAGSPSLKVAWTH